MKIEKIIDKKKQDLMILEERKVRIIKNQRNIYLPKESVKKLKTKNFKKIATVGLVGTFALSAILMISNDKEINKEIKTEKETTKVEKKTETIVELNQPLKSSLVAKAILPIPKAQVEAKKDKLVLKETEGKFVHAPLTGEVKKIENDKVSIQVDTGEVVEISNVEVEKVIIGEKLLQGEVIGTAKEELEITISEKGVHFTEVDKLLNQEKTEKLNTGKFEDWHKGGTSVESFETDEEKIHFVGKLFQRENLKLEPEKMIFPSIPTTQLFVETGGMESELAINALNFGGIKADKHWNGPTYKKKTKEQDANGKEFEVLADFRAYDTVEAYVIDYIQRLEQSPWMEERYAGYRVVNAKNQEAALDHLSQRYATDKNYKEKATNVLESRNLKELDENVLEIATGQKTVEEVEQEIVAEFEEKNKVEEKEKQLAEATVIETEKKAKEVEMDVVTEPFGSDVMNEVNFKGTETTLNQVNFAEMSEEEAKEIIEEMVDLNIYLETKNEFLEKLLLKANIEGIVQELNGDYAGKYLDFLMEASYRAIEEGQLTEKDKQTIKKRKEGKATVEVEGEVYVIENPEAVASYDEDLTEKFKREYSRMTYGMTKLSLKGMKITLDSGHALKKGTAWIADPGASTVAKNGRSEAQINWEYTTQFKQFLEALGAEVTLLNQNGEHDLRAGDRGYKANQLGNSVLFSIHFNSTGDRTVNGTEVALGTLYDEVDVNFANIIQKHQAKAMHTNDDRGLAKTRDVGMLANAKSPKGDIIVEASFLSNIYGMMQAESDVVKYSLMNAWVAGLAELNGTLGEETPKEAIKWQEERMLELATKVGKEVKDVLAMDEEILFKKEEKEKPSKVEIDSEEKTNSEVKEEKENTEEKVGSEEEKEAKVEKETKENKPSEVEKETKEENENTEEKVESEEGEKDSEKTENVLEEEKEEAQKDETFSEEKDGEKNVLNVLGLSIANISDEILNILF